MCPEYKKDVKKEKKSYWTILQTLEQYIENRAAENKRYGICGVGSQFQNWGREKWGKRKNKQTKRTATFKNQLSHLTEMYLSCQQRKA